MRARPRARRLPPLPYWLLMTKSRRLLLPRLPKRPSRPSPAHDDAFFRHIVAGMRNGVLAITRDGHLALMNEEAYRIFGVPAQHGDLGKPVADVLGGHPEIVR